MKKLSKATRAIVQIAKNPWLLNTVLNQDNHWQQYVHRKYPDNENGLPMVRADSIFGGFEETVYPYASLDGSSLPTDLALLKQFARSFDKCSYFEIGTWRGESVANVATVAEKCYTLNLTTEQMKKIGMNDRYIGLHRFFSSNLENVTHLQGDSREFDYAKLNRKFDLVFIDGDHHYDLVKNDTEKVFRHLLHDNSVVVWHDYGYNPERVRFEVLAGILDGCPQKFHSSIYHVGNTMCAVYMNKDFDSSPFETPQIPAGAFEVSIGWKTTLEK